MPLFTVIAEYRGGTYIDQVRAASAPTVLKTLCAKTQSSLPKAVVSGLKRLVGESDSPVQIHGCKNVWCTSEGYRGGLLLINIIQTADGTSRASH